MMRPLLFWIILDCWTTVVLSSIDFAQQPATKYAYSNRSSSFQCVCSGCAGNFWKINSINANYPVNKDKGVTSTGPVVNSDGFKEYTLSVPGIPFFNNSNITCIIYKGFNVKTSAIAKLYIQGYASAVTHISVIQLNSTTLQLQFQPSYALHETVSVDCYIVEVTGVGNEYISMLNSTSTVVTVFMTDPCTSYIISVTPHNVVGLGEKIIETDVIVFQEPTTVNEISFKMTFKQNLVLFNVDTSCLGSIPQLMDVSITCVSTNSSCTSTHISSCLLNILSTTSTGNCSIDIRNSSLSNIIMEVEMNLTDHLSQGYHYVITVTLRTTSSPVVPSLMSTLNLSTFDTVEASITSFSETSVCINCSLRADSIMTGCLAVFEDHEDNIIKYIIKQIPDEVIAYNCFHNLQDGVYTVSVTDVAFYDSHHEHIAFVLSNNLTIKNEHEPSGKTSLVINGMESTRLMMSSLMYQSSTSDEEEIISLTVTPVVTVTINESKDSNTPLILTAVLLPVMGSFIILLLIVTAGCYCKKIQLSKGGQRNDEFDVTEVAMKTCVAYETCSINPAYATINQRREDVCH